MSIKTTNYAIQSPYTLASILIDSRKITGSVSETYLPEYEPFSNKVREYDEGCRDFLSQGGFGHFQPPGRRIAADARRFLFFYLSCSKEPLKATARLP